MSLERFEGTCGTSVALNTALDLWLIRQVWERFNASISVAIITNLYIIWSSLKTVLLNGFVSLLLLGNLARSLPSPKSLIQCLWVKVAFASGIAICRSYGLWYWIVMINACLGRHMECHLVFSMIFLPHGVIVTELFQKIDLAALDLISGLAWVTLVKALPASVPFQLGNLFAFVLYGLHELNSSNSKCRGILSFVRRFLRYLPVL